MNYFIFAAVLTLDNSIVDLETIEALYENVSHFIASKLCSGCVVSLDSIFIFMQFLFYLVDINTTRNILFQYYSGVR